MVPQRQLLHEAVRITKLKLLASERSVRCLHESFWRAPGLSSSEAVRAEAPYRSFGWPLVARQHSLRTRAPRGNPGPDLGPEKRLESSPARSRGHALAQSAATLEEGLADRFGLGFAGEERDLFGEAFDFGILDVECYASPAKV